MKRFTEMRWPLLDQALVSASNFLVGVVLVRAYGVEEYGIYVLLWAIVQFTQSFQGALFLAPMQTIPQSFSSKNQDEYFASTAKCMSIFAIACGASTWALLLILQQWLPAFWKPDYAPALAIWIIAMHLQDGTRRIQLARDKGVRAFAGDLLAYPGQIATIILAEYLGLTLSTTIIIFSAILVLSSIVAGLPEQVTRKHGEMTSIALWNFNWPQSRWLAGTALLQWLSGNYALMTAAVVLGPSVTGAIRASQNLLAVTHVLFQGLENIVPVRSAKIYFSEGWNALIGYTKKTAFFLIGITAIIAFIALILAEPILKTVYGTAPLDSLLAAAWYVPIYLTIAAALPARTILRTIGHTRPIFLAYLFSAALSVSVSKIAAENFGTNGVMFTVLMCYAAILFVTSLSAFSSANKLRNQLTPPRKD